MDRPTPFLRRVPRRRVRQRGAAVVELALLLLPLLLMIGGTEELGRALYTYNSLDKSVRDAARLLSSNAPGDPVSRQQAACLAVYGNTGCSGNPLVSGLTLQNVSECDAVSCPSTHASQDTGQGSVNLATVTLTGVRFNVVFQLAMTDVTFDNISVTMRAPL